MKATSDFAWRTLAGASLALLTFLALCSGGASRAAAQSQEGTGPGADNPLRSISWVQGPAIGKLGEAAEIRVPEGAAFTDASGTRKFLEATQNIPRGNELGTLIQPSENGDGWFVIFSFEDVGYVKDDEKNSLDGDAILDSIKKGTAAANEERRKRGWQTIDIVGWEQPPAYDPETHNLIWAIRGRSPDGEVVNYKTRLLGRRGVMSAELVVDPAELAASVPAFKQALGGFQFSPGNRYAEFRAGDKVAKYGLTALVVGGAAAIAAKTGLLAKFWKLIVAGVVGIGAWLKRVFGTRRGGTDPITRVPDRES